MYKGHLSTVLKVCERRIPRRLKVGAWPGGSKFQNIHFTMTEAETVRDQRDHDFHVSCAWCSFKLHITHTASVAEGASAQQAAPQLSVPWATHAGLPIVPPTVPIAGPNFFNSPHC